MSDECRRCRICNQEFRPGREASQDRPDVCVLCVEEVRRELAAIEADLEQQALDYGLWNRCPEL